MTHGTMPATLPELDEEPERVRGRRTGLKIAAAVVVVALGAAGAYAAIGGGSPNDTAGTKTSASTAAKVAADKKAADKKAAEKAADKAKADTDAAVPVKAKAAAKPKPLPSAKNMTIAEKRAALISYLKAGEFPLTADSSPATAAKGACTLLDGGMKTDKLITELSRGADVTEAQGRYFLVGATHFYCSKYSVES